MIISRRLSTSVLLVFSLLVIGSTARTDRAAAPSEFKCQNVQRIKQMENYCGPACLTAVLQYLGQKITQEDVGKAVYDAKSGATNGADMLLFAIDKGFCAYSWNSSVSDVKAKLADGLPVIVLQQNSLVDTSGHYRVLTGYNDAASKFYVMDPYYDNVTEMTYSQCRRLWDKMGDWALLVVPTDKDTFKDELDLKNPVVHMDLSYAEFKRKSYTDALKEANVALTLEPSNDFAKSMVTRIQRAMGAGAK